MPAFNDNYIWLLHSGGSRKAAVVDPGDAKPVINWLSVHHTSLEAILITHYHPDHIGGIEDLLHWHAEQGFEPPRVYAPAQEHIAHVSDELQEGDTLDVSALGLTLTVMEVPGHTLGHIAYYAAGQSASAQTPLLWCGDTLFAAGCGRMFEGTAEQMHGSLQRLGALPQDTVVYCTHEYTLSNLRFAVAAEPDNLLIVQRQTVEQDKRAKDLPTVPSSIGLERATNPFLRAKDAADFGRLRAWKDRF